MISAYNSTYNEFIDVNAGYLIVKTFARLYVDYNDRYALRRDVYAIPRIDREPTEYTIQYRGLDRDALDDYADSEINAEVRLALLVIDNHAVDGIIFLRSDAEDVYTSLGQLQSEYEIIWSRIAGIDMAPPDGYLSIGFEPTYFASDHFSASCDCMLFPRWHSTDEEEELFLPYFRQLNEHGLFMTPEVAKEFLDYYLSFDWTEHDEYIIAEIYLRE